MPAARAAVEELKQGLANGTVRPDEKLHIVFVEREQKRRIKNVEGSTRFVLVCDTPEAYSELHAERDRIIRKVGNKAIAIDFMTKAWKALTDQMLDRMLAAEDIKDGVV